jgi:hypothetical protein
LPLNLSDQGLGLLVKVAFIAAIVFTVHVVVSYAYGLGEAYVVVEKIKRTILRPIKI